MKTLNYPGLITKSHLITIGCAHSWPSLVAVLDWLADAVNLAYGPAEDDSDPVLMLLPRVDNNGESAGGERGRERRDVTGDVPLDTPSPAPRRQSGKISFITGIYLTSQAKISTFPGICVYCRIWQTSLLAACYQLLTRFL